MRGRLFERTVARMRTGHDGDWSTDRPNYDRTLVRRLMNRVGYGGKKGRRAFLRLWALRIRPSATRVTAVIRGFELQSVEGL